MTDSKCERISIIIPTLDEAATILPTLQSTEKAVNVERIVVDGGSTDETLQMACLWGVRVFACNTGRAQQMNRGANAATGELFLFLHADTRLPENFDDYVRQVLGQPGVIAGAFQLRIDASSRGLSLIEEVANWRSRILQMPYGDQAIFLRASLFHDLGGFLNIPILEDFELVRRLRRRGRIKIAPVAVVTSARRWKNRGVWHTTILNHVVILAYYLGIQPARIARWYYRNGSTKDN